MVKSLRCPCRENDFPTYLDSADHRLIFQPLVAVSLARHHAGTPTLSIVVSVEP